MKLSSLVITATLSAVVAFGVSKYTAPTVDPAFAKPETAFERVMNTNTLRCGYYVFPPMVVRDPNTGKMSGFTVDMMELIAHKTGLKIEWTEESTFGNWIPALQANRYDVMCAPMWPDMALGRETIFTRPMFYAGIYPLVREDDTRFDGPDAMEKLNSPDVTVAAQDGNVIGYLAKEVLPKAKVLSGAAQMDGPTLVQNVTTGKADVILLDRNGLIEYNNKGLKLKLIELPRPLKAQPFALPLQHRDTELREFMDNAIMDMLASGSIDRLLAKWESQPGKIFLRAAPTYETSK